MSLEQYPRHSLRQDAAMRACRDGDSSTLQRLIDQAQLFENPAALKQACQSGLWGDPKLSSNNTSGNASGDSYSTKDSVLLHNLLFSAVTRAHADIIQLLLDRFPARHLHVAEWELVVSALGTGDVQVIKPFVDIDPDLIKLLEPKVGNCFDVLFSLNSDSDDLKPIVEYLLERGANVYADEKGTEVLAKANDLLSPDVVLMMRGNKLS
jgi:hypothetical protein